MVTGVSQWVLVLERERVLGEERNWGQPVKWPLSSWEVVWPHSTLGAPPGARQMLLEEPVATAPAMAAKGVRVGVAMRGRAPGSSQRIVASGRREPEKSYMSRTG